MTRLIPLLLVLGLAALPALAEDDRPLLLGSTTSTRDSGLLDAILPEFTEKTGIEVRVIAVGTGRALQLGRSGDVDVLLVHDRASEDAFVAEGYGTERRDVMYNDFVIVGPSADPAGIRGETSAAAALRRVREREAPFLSRGDDSGTHKAERRLWKAAGIDPTGASGTWYRESGAGMGATLNTAAELGAYTLADRGTWLSFKNRRDLTIVVEGDPSLHNPYGVIPVSPKRHPHVNAAGAEALVDWLTSAAGQAAIAAFRVDGQPLFFVATPTGD